MNFLVFRFTRGSRMRGTIICNTSVLLYGLTLYYALNELLSVQRSQVDTCTRLGHHVVHIKRFGTCIFHCSLTFAYSDIENRYSRDYRPLVDYRPRHY